MQGRSALAHNTAGAEFLALGRCGDAVSSFRAALAGDAGFADAAANLGKALIGLGELDEALVWIERAIALEPANGHFYLLLLSLGIESIQPRHIDALLELGSSAERLPRAQRRDLHFALGQVFEHAGRFADAFGHFSAGNALKRAEIAYDEAAEARFLQASLASFANPVMEQLRGCGNPSPRPLFIFGMPRSGSTLVEQLLAAHPAVAGAGELGILGGIVRDAWSGMAPATLDDLRLGVRGIGERYLAVTDPLAAPGMRLTDKTLYNMQFAPLINVTLPNARMIHVRRDALDTCWSCFSTSFAGPQVPFSYDLGELGRYHRAYADMMERWRAFIPADRLLDVQYEELVGDFESVARRIVAFCGLAWDPACLAFHVVRRPVLTASNVQVRRPLYRRAVGRAQPFVPFLAPLIASMRGA